ncbi:MAG: TetR/AcrR family transcriptional regulator [Propionibacteriaceae bacterium]
MARPTTPLLNRGLIRDTALSLIDSEGLAAFSLRRLARELGVQAPSLYSHFPHRESVLDAVANHLTAAVDTSGFAGGDWAHGLSVWAHSYHAALSAHPEAAPIVAAGAGDRADYLAMADEVHGGLVGAGWPPRQATMIAAAVKYLVIGAATTPFASGFATDTRVYLDRYPNLSQAHRLPEMAEQIDTESFALALRSLIAGLRPLHPAATA